MLKQRTLQERAIIESNATIHREWCLFDKLQERCFGGKELTVRNRFPPKCSFCALYYAVCRELFKAKNRGKKRLIVSSLLEASVAPTYADSKQHHRRDVASQRKDMLAWSKVLRVAEGNPSDVPKGVPPRHWEVLHRAIAIRDNPPLLLDDSRIFLRDGAMSKVSPAVVDSAVADHHDADESSQPDGSNIGLGPATTAFCVESPSSRNYCKGKALVTIVRYPHAVRVVASAPESPAGLPTATAHPATIVAFCNCRDWCFKGLFCVHFLVAVLPYVCSRIGSDDLDHAAQVLADMFRDIDSFFHRTACFKSGSQVPLACLQVGAAKLGTSSFEDDYGVLGHEHEHGSGSKSASDLSQDEDLGCPGPGDNGKVIPSRHDVLVLQFLVETVQDCLHNKSDLTVVAPRKFNPSQLSRLGRLLGAITGTQAATPAGRVGTRTPKGLLVGRPSRHRSWTHLRLNKDVDVVHDDGQSAESVETGDDDASSGAAEDRDLAWVDHDGAPSESDTALGLLRLDELQASLRCGTTKRRHWDFRLGLMYVIAEVALNLNRQC